MFANWKEYLQTGRKAGAALQGSPQKTENKAR